MFPQRLVSRAAGSRQLPRPLWPLTWDSPVTCLNGTFRRDGSGGLWPRPSTLAQGPLRPRVYLFLIQPAPQPLHLGCPWPCSHSAAVCVAVPTQGAHSLLLHLPPGERGVLNGPSPGIGLSLRGEELTPTECSLSCPHSSPAPAGSSVRSAWPGLPKPEGLEPPAQQHLSLTQDRTRGLRNTHPTPPHVPDLLSPRADGSKAASDPCDSRSMALVKDDAVILDSWTWCGGDRKSVV